MPPACGVEGNVVCSWNFYTVCNNDRSCNHYILAQIILCRKRLTVYTMFGSHSESKEIILFTLLLSNWTEPNTLYEQNRYNRFSERRHFRKEIKYNKAVQNCHCAILWQLCIQGYPKSIYNFRYVQNGLGET